MSSSSAHTTALCDQGFLLRDPSGEYAVAACASACSFPNKTARMGRDVVGDDAHSGREIQVGDDIEIFRNVYALFVQRDDAGPDPGSTLMGTGKMSASGSTDPLTGIMLPWKSVLSMALQRGGYALRMARLN